MPDNYKAVTQQIKHIAVEYRKRLQEIINTENSNDDVLVKKLICQTLREKIIQDYTEHLGLSLPKVIESHLQLIRNSNLTVDDKDDEFILKDFLQQDFTLDWLCLSMFTLGGVYIFAAKSKSGKTDFMTYLIRCITLPKLTFLGLPCKKGKILIFQVEESKVNIRIKAKNHGLDSFYRQDEAGEAYDVAVVRSIDLFNDFNKFERKIDKYEPVLVIIDTIRGAMSRSGLDENHSSYADIFYQVQALAIRKNITIMCLHHTNKTSTDSKKDPLDEVSGTSKLTSIGDGTIVLKRNDESNDVFLHFITRDVGRKTLILRRTKNKFRVVNYEIVQQLGVPDVCLAQFNKILVLLKLKGRLTEQQMSSLLNTSVARTLDYLCEQYLIDYVEQDFELIYFIPKEAIPLWDSALTKEEIDAVNLAIEMAHAENVEDIEQIKEKTNDVERKKALHLLPDVDKLEVWKTKYPPKFNGFAYYQEKKWLVNVESLEKVEGQDEPIYLYRLCSTMGDSYPNLVAEPDLDVLPDEQLQHNL